MYYADLDKNREVRFLTVKELNDIALTIIPKDHIHVLIPQYLLPAEAITILTNRAIQKGLAIF